MSKSLVYYHQHYYKQNGLNTTNQSNVRITMLSTQSNQSNKSNQLTTQSNQSNQSNKSNQLTTQSNQLTTQSNQSNNQTKDENDKYDLSDSPKVTLNDRVNLDKIFELFELINKTPVNGNNRSFYDCFKCDSQDSVKSVDNGIFVCVTCGEVKGTEISEEFECQYSGMGFGDRTGTARSGLSNNNLLFKSNFSTKLVGNNTSYGLKQINNVWDSLDYKERTLLKIFKKITDNCRRHGIPNNVISNSQVLYKQVYEKQRSSKTGSKGSRSDNLEGLIAACIFYSCKSYQISRNHDEIAAICDLASKEVSHGCKVFHKLMYREIDLVQYQTTYKNFIERFSSHLSLKDEETRTLEEFCDETSKSGLLNSCKPATFVAICVYFCSVVYGFDLEKKQISQQCDITEATLNKHYRFLLDNLDKVII